jgi:hypothetical protein
MKTIMYIALGTVQTAVVGCGGGNGGSTKLDASTPDGSTTRPDGSTTTPDGSTTTPDGGSPSDGPVTLNLVEWVTDLIENRSRPEAVPEPLEEKIIVDTSDPAAFDSLLSK